MTSSLSTRPIRDGAGATFQQRVLDVSGTGAGPYLPVQTIAGPEDGVPVDLAALFDALGGRLEAAIGAPTLPLGHQSVTVTSTATSLAGLLTAAAGTITAIPAGTKAIWLQPRGDGIRYAAGGSTPTTASDVTGIGTDLYEGQQVSLSFRDGAGAIDFSTLKFIAASSVLLSIAFEG